MGIERGSTWNRWDFHVHTPYSVLNNQFGFEPDPDYKNDVPEFDEYVRNLFTKAVEHGVVGIGITASHGKVPFPIAVPCRWEDGFFQV